MGIRSNGRQTYNIKIVKNASKETELAEPKDYQVYSVDSLTSLFYSFDPEQMREVGEKIPKNQKSIFSANSLELKRIMEVFDTFIGRDIIAELSIKSGIAKKGISLTLKKNREGYEIIATYKVSNSTTGEGKLSITNKGIRNQSTNIDLSNYLTGLWSTLQQQKII